MSRRSADRDRIWTTDPNMSLNCLFARMSEWSKEPDLRPGANSAWVRTPLRACIVCCLPTAERCLSVGGFLLKFISSFLIYIFQILMSAVCRRHGSVACLPTAYKHSTVLYSWYPILFYYESVERFQLNTQIKNIYTVSFSLLSADIYRERCSMYYIIIVLRSIFDTLYSSIMNQ